MERKARGVMKDGAALDCLFDAAPGMTETIKKGATLDDTIAMLPQKVREKKEQARLVAAKLLDLEQKVENTCHNIWKFLTEYIAYTPDQKGKEQVRSVRRLWSDKIGDCDCFSFFTSCVLSILHIPHRFRIASYDKVNGTFGHVYVIVPTRSGKYITIDAVLPDFNREHPYEKIKDIDMDLEFLDGIDPEQFTRNGGMSFDAQDILSCQLPNMDESVGSLRTFVSNVKDKLSNAKEKVKETFQKAKPVVGKTLHMVNRVNPATVALRLGVLSAMKLNMFGVAGQLRYAYLSDAEAQKRGINMARFARYKTTREKLEKIFFGAGGKPENLKEAILTGKGNQDKAVALSGYPLAGLGYTGSSSVRDIVGEEMYADEFPSNEPELSGLGIVETAAAVATASGVIATIAGILKNIGSLFDKGQPGSDPGFEKLDEQTPDDSGGENQRESEQPSTETPDSGETPPDETPEPSFMDKAKEWAVKNKTPLIIGGVCIVGLGGLLLYRKFAGGSKGGGRRAEATNGVPDRGRSKTRGDGRTKQSRNEKILKQLRLTRMK